MEQTIHDIGRELKQRVAGKRIAVLGLGNLERGDDGFGVHLVRNLAGRGLKLALIEGGTAPENYIGPVLRANPEILILVDAANLHAEPGHTHLVEKHEIAALGLSTHDAAVNLFISFIEQSLAGVDIFLIGVQPEQTQFGSDMSRTLTERVKFFEELFVEIG